jgi:glycosyltransferase involved in cell wall biosynthesis
MDEPLKIALSAGIVGGIGGMERNVFTVCKAMEAHTIDIFAMQLWFEKKRDQLHITIDRTKSYDLYLYYAAGSPIYIGDKIDVRKKVLMPSGSDVRSLERKFDYVICQGDDGTKYFDDMRKKALISPCVCIPVDHTVPVRNLPPAFFLTVFNPYDLSRNYDDGMRPTKGYDLLYELADHFALPLVWCHSDQSLEVGHNIVKHSNIMHFHNLSQEKMYYLYEKATAYVSFSREEGFGWSIADALMFDKPIISRNVGVISSLEAEQTGVYVYSNANELKGLLKRRSFECKPYDKTRFSPKRFEQSLWCLAGRSSPSCSQKAKEGKAKTPERPRLSLCMIVKDEEAMLARCLQSVDNWVDEIVIVDTGSTDRTLDIAKAFNAKIYVHPWEGDFSKHRNQSLDYAQGEWILQLDADEELVEDSGSKIRKAIEQQDTDAFFVTLLSPFNEGASCTRESKIRLFRRSPMIRYENRVHEEPKGYQREKVLGATIYHHGYCLGTDEEKIKIKRNIKLIKGQIAEDPENYWHRHNLAASYAANFMFQDAVDEGLRALHLAHEQGRHNSNVLWTYYIVAASYLKMDNLDKAEELALRAVGKASDHLDSHFVLVLVYYQRKQWDKLASHMEAFFQIADQTESSPDQFKGSMILTAGERWRVRVALGDLCLNRDDFQGAQEAFQKALSETTVAWECMKMIGDCYKNQSMWEEASDCYRKSIEKKPEYTDAVLGLAVSAKHLGDVEEAMTCYEEVLQHDPNALEALVNLGDFHYDQGQSRPAGHYYKRALEIESGLLLPSLRLANLSAKRREFEACVAHCEDILRSLGLPCDRTLSSLKDLADLFLVIGHEFDKGKRDDLFMEAAEIAVTIQPELLDS